MKVTLITGASGGIGEAFARKLAAEKHNLVLVARSENKLKELCKELAAAYSVAVQYIALDLIKPDADKSLFDETKKRGFEVDWVINNAGIGSGGDFLEYSLQSMMDMMQLNMNAMVALTHQFLPQMRARKSGTIINAGSMAGFSPIPYMAVYAASKAFVQSFTEALIEENKPYGIQTMLLCPGATETGFFEAANIGADRKNAFSTKKLETPEQVVETALRGIRKKKRIAISGTINQLSRVVHFISNLIGLPPLFARQMRAQLKSKTV